MEFVVSNSANSALEASIAVFPGDTIVVPKADVVYILGDVNRPGGIAMVTNDSKLSAVQAISLAGGTPPNAVPSHARPIRKQADGTQAEIPSAASVPCRKESNRICRCRQMTSSMFPSATHEIWRQARAVWSARHRRPQSIDFNGYSARNRPVNLVEQRRSPVNEFVLGQPGQEGANSLSTERSLITFLLTLVVIAVGLMIVVDGALPQLEMAITGGSLLFTLKPHIILALALVCMLLLKGRFRSSPFLPLALVLLSYAMVEVFFLHFFPGSKYLFDQAFLRVFRPSAYSWGRVGSSP